MKQRVTYYYLASLVVLFASGLTAANISKRKIAANTQQIADSPIIQLVQNHR